MYASPVPNVGQVGSLYGPGDGGHLPLVSRRRSRTIGLSNDTLDSKTEQATFEL